MTVVEELAKKNRLGFAFCCSTFWLVPRAELRSSRE